MGLYDRDYVQDGFQQGRGYYQPHMRMSFPRLTSVVKWLLIINVGVYLISIIIQPLGRLIYSSFQLDTSSWQYMIQIWRLITYQFLHDPNSAMHIFFNMLGLYFLGPTLERHWGSKRFIIFYLGCGAAGGLFYYLLVLIGFLAPLPMVGASGAILGMLAACAILFPHFVVFILFFPVPIRIAAIGLTFVYLVAVITRGANAGGDAAHLAGMVAGALYVFWSLGAFRRFTTRINKGNWEKKLQQQRDLQMEVDRILDKVQRTGIHSLTSKEKTILKKATKLEQERMKV